MQNRELQIKPKFPLKIRRSCEPGDFDQGTAGAEDLLLSRIGEDQENKDIGDPNALVFDENEDNSLGI